MILIASGAGVVACPIIGGIATAREAKRLLIEEAAPEGKFPAQYEIHRAAFSDAQAVGKALNGVRELVLIPKIEPNLIAKQHNLIEQAKHAGVEEVALVSMIGAQRDSCFRVLRWFGVIESELIASGMKYTILRTAPFMQSLLLFLEKNAARRTIFAPFRDAVFPWVDARDVGAATARLAMEPASESRIHNITGPQQLGFPEIAESISSVLGKEFNYVDITTHEAWGHLESRGLSPLKTIALTEWWDALVNGFVEMPCCSGLQSLLGREPTTLQEFIVDHAEPFGGVAAAAHHMPEHAVAAAT
jgi:uncharacterized protein YbjT (DUF2867 family)